MFHVLYGSKKLNSITSPERSVATEADSSDTARCIIFLTDCTDLHSLFFSSVHL